VVALLPALFQGPGGYDMRQKGRVCGKWRCPEQVAFLSRLISETFQPKV